MLFVGVPTVMLIDGLRVVIYPNDHRPTHVHVMGDGCEVVFELQNRQATVRQNFGFRSVTIARIKASLEAAYDHLVAEWERIHGPNF
jgi:hypothetical protein